MLTEEGRIEACDTRRGVANDTLIRRFPNGITHFVEITKDPAHEVVLIYQDILVSGRTPGELKHLSTRRKRNHRDSVSSGERTRNSPNHIPAREGWCCRTTDLNVMEVTKEKDRRRTWKWSTTEGDSPVIEIVLSSSLFLSTMGYD